MVTQITPEAVEAAKALAASARYPDFKGDLAAEVIWLQSQVVHWQRMFLFQTERLRLRADLWEARQELSLLHKGEADRLQKRLTDLEYALARGSDSNGRKMILGAPLDHGGTEAQRPTEWNVGENVVVCSVCGKPAVTMAHTRSGKIESVCGEHARVGTTAAEHNALPKGQS